MAPCQASANDAGREPVKHLLERRLEWRPNGILGTDLHDDPPYLFVGQAEAPCRAEDASQVPRVGSPSTSVIALGNKDALYCEKRIVVGVGVPVWPSIEQLHLAKLPDRARSLVNSAWNQRLDRCCDPALTTNER